MTDERAMTGRLAGIARHAVPKGPMEVIDTALQGDDGGAKTPPPSTYTYTFKVTVWLILAKAH